MELLEIPLFATQPKDVTIHSQSSAFAIGGRLLDAAQAVPVAGHACATVLVTVYEAELVELGVAEANCLERAVKSASLLTVVPETDTRPKSLLDFASWQMKAKAHHNRLTLGSTCRRSHRTRHWSYSHRRLPGPQ